MKGILIILWLLLRTHDPFPHPDNVKLEILTYEGKHDRSHAIWLAMGEANPAELLSGLDATLRTEGRWTPQHATGKSMETHWTFIDDAGRKWHARSSVSAFSGQTDVHTVRLEIWSQ